LATTGQEAQAQETPLPFTQQLEERFESIGLTNIDIPNPIEEPGNSAYIHGYAWNNPIVCIAETDAQSPLALENTDATCWQDIYGPDVGFTDDLPFTQIEGNEDCKTGPRPLVSISPTDIMKLGRCAEDLRVTITIPKDTPPAKHIGTLCYAYENAMMGIIPGTVVFADRGSKKRFEKMCKP